MTRYLIGSRSVTFRKYVSTRFVLILLFIFCLQKQDWIPRQVWKFKNRNSRISLSYKGHWRRLSKILVQFLERTEYKWFENAYEFMQQGGGYSSFFQQLHMPMWRHIDKKRRTEPNLVPSSHCVCHLPDRGKSGYEIRLNQLVLWRFPLPPLPPSWIHVTVMAWKDTFLNFVLCFLFLFCPDIIRCMTLFLICEIPRSPDDSISSGESTHALWDNLSN